MIINLRVKLKTLTSDPDTWQRMKQLSFEDFICVNYVPGKQYWITQCRILRFDNGFLIKFPFTKRRILGVCVCGGVVWLAWGPMSSGYVLVVFRSIIRPLLSEPFHRFHPKCIL